jgi:hypothetical protein
MLLALLCSSSLAGENPSGSLWTPWDAFNLSAYPAIVRDGDFRILQLTDLHINGPNPYVVEALSMVEDLITKINPDLVIVTGDCAGGPINGIFGDILVDFLDTFQIPYTMALGNHDGEGGHDDEAMAAIYARGQYSLFDRGPGSIHGFCNSAINLLNSAGKAIYSLITIDTNRYREYPGGIDQDYIYPDQIMWYEWFVSGISGQQGRLVKSALFYHMPLLEIFDLESDFRKEDPDGAAFAFRENPCPGPNITGLLQKVKDLASTSHMFFGHDHNNLLNYRWQGVNWIYGLKTGTSSYHDPDRLGGTLITISQNSTLNVEFVYMPDPYPWPSKRATAMIEAKGMRIERPKIRPVGGQKKRE